MGARRLANGAALLVVAAFLVGAALYSRSLGSQAEVGKPAPAFELTDLEGGRVALASFAGRPVFINFWTSWCDPCREEIPALETFHRRFGERMPVIGVNVREPLPIVQEFARAMQMTYPIVRDIDGRLSERYRLRGYPESWVVGPDGVARHYWPGPVTFEQMEQAYAQVMGRPITEGLPDGGPLPADEPGVGLAVASARLWVAGRHRLMAAGLDRLDRPEGWVVVDLPDGTASLDAIASWPEGEAVVVASGSRLWRRESGDGPWRALPDAPGSVLSLAGAGDELIAWIRGRGGYALDADGRWQALPSGGLPLMAGSAWMGRLGGGLVAATPAGLLESREPSGPFSRTRLARPSWAVVETGGAWMVATDRGVYRYDPARGEAAPAAGTPTRVLVALAALPDGRLAALALDGDLYLGSAVEPAGPGAVGAWEPLGVPRGTAGP